MVPKILIHCFSSLPFLPSNILKFRSILFSIYLRHSPHPQYKDRVEIIISDLTESHFRPNRYFFKNTNLLINSAHIVSNFENSIANSAILHTRFHFTELYEKLCSFDRIANRQSSYFFIWFSLQSRELWTNLVLFSVTLLSDVLTNVGLNFVR